MYHSLMSHRVGGIFRLKGYIVTEYLLSRLVAFTAANMRVFRVSPAIGMDNC